MPVSPDTIVGIESTIPNEVVNISVPANYISVADGSDPREVTPTTIALSLQNYIVSTEGESAFDTPDIVVNNTRTTSLS